MLAHKTQKMSKKIEHFFDKYRLNLELDIKWCTNKHHSYEWGYTAGPPMAVAPLPNVRAVLDYAVTEIPAGKIFLGIPNYGYDWPLPFVRGTTRAQSISNQRAIDLAIEHDIAIQFDETAQAPFFHYTDGGGTVHEVWFEDARSLDAKLRLIAEYGFQGGGVWNLMRPYSQIWQVMAGLYDIW